MLDVAGIADRDIAEQALAQVGTGDDVDHQGGQCTEDPLRDLGGGVRLPCPVLLWVVNRLRQAPGMPPRHMGTRC
jgi:hypothetical protein